MLIDFNQKEEITIPGMNNGTGTMTAKMYMDEQGKVIPCSIHAGGSIGLHKHETSDDINVLYQNNCQQYQKRRDDEDGPGKWWETPKNQGIQRVNEKRRAEA